MEFSASVLANGRRVYYMSRVVLYGYDGRDGYLPKANRDLVGNL